MEAEGETISFVTSEEENDLHGIEKALGKTIPRVTLPDFDYKASPPPKVRGQQGPRYPRDSRGGGGDQRWRRGPPRR
jgi:superfamily II DNA/RNA helicase